MVKETEFHNQTTFLKIIIIIIKVSEDSWKRYKIALCKRQLFESSRWVPLVKKKLNFKLEMIFRGEKKNLIDDEMRMALDTWVYGIVVVFIFPWSQSENLLFSVAITLVLSQSIPRDFFADGIKMRRYLTNIDFSCKSFYDFLSRASFAELKRKPDIFFCICIN